MNILFLAKHLDIGGITNYIFNLAGGINSKGHNAVVVSSGGQMAEEFQKNGIKTVIIDLRTKREIGLKAAYAIPKLLNIIKENDIEIIHSNTRVTQVISGILCAMTGIKHVTTYHGFFKNKLIRRLFPFMGDRVIAVSEPVKDYLINGLKVSPAKIEMIHNGIDTGFFLKTFSVEEKDSIRKDFGLLKDSKVICIIARLSTVKGHPDFLKAFSAIYNKRKDIEGLVIGEGEIKEDLLRLSEKLGIADAVHFRDSVSDTRLPLAVTDIFVMPSLMEGFGIAILEAMAAGKAVIATDIGGVRELIENGRTGLLVKPGDPEGLADAIKKLLADGPLRTRLGENARISAAQKFPIEKTVEKTIELYNSVHSC